MAPLLVYEQALEENRARRDTLSKSLHACCKPVTMVIFRVKEMARKEIHIFSKALAH